MYKPVTWLWTREGKESNFLGRSGIIRSYYTATGSKLDEISYVLQSQKGVKWRSQCYKHGK